MPEVEELDMVRLTIRVPVETRDMIYDWAMRAGLKPYVFMPVALMIGSRLLARQLLPEDFVTSGMLEEMAKATAANMDRGQIEQAFKMVSENPELMKTMKELMSEES